MGHSHIEHRRRFDSTSLNFSFTRLSSGLCSLRSTENGAACCQRVRSTHGEHMSCKIPRLLLLVTVMIGALSFVGAPVASAQVTTAEISGLVKDSQGAVVPGATITAVHEPSGTTYSGVTQGD